MPIRKLGSLSNLAGYATHNNRQTTARKVKKKPGGSSGPLLLPPGSLQSTWLCECEKHSGRALREARFSCSHSPKISLWNQSTWDGLGTGKNFITGYIHHQRKKKISKRIIGKMWIHWFFQTEFVICWQNWSGWYIYIYHHLTIHEWEILST